MRKSLFTVVQLCAAFLFAIPVFAQYNNEILGPRLYVHNPSTIQGIKKFTYSSNPDMTGPWGRKLDTTYVNVPLIRVTDSLGCAGTITTLFDANQWALIYRGNCEFGAKALAAQQKGAKGVIIVNHTAGVSLVNMAAGASGGQVTIPVLFISKEDGDAINKAIIAGNQVRISLTPWGFGYSHDLAIVPGTAALPPYGAIPFTQASFTDAAAYRNYTSAFVANTGKSTEKAIKLKSVTTWTPTGGSASIIHSDSVAVDSLRTVDSIDIVAANASYYTPATTSGTISTTFSVSAQATDSFSFDNTVTNTTYVGPNAFSKARYDVAKGQPIASNSLRFTTGSPFTWGPMFYVRKGGYAANSVQFAINDGDTSQHALSASTSIIAAYIFKWKDGSANNIKDSIMEAAEMTLVGTAIKTFTTADSNNKVFIAPVTDALGNPNPVILEDTTFYWVAVPIALSGQGLCVDYDINYFYRTFAAGTSSAKSWDYYAPMFMGDQDAVKGGSATDTLLHYPFISSATVAKHPEQLSFTQQDGLVPAVALNINQFTTNVKDVVNYPSYVEVFPNPATNGNVNISLSKGSGNFIQLQVLDGVGRVVYTVNNDYVEGHNYSVNTSSLAAGHYYLKLQGTDKIAVRQFDVIAK